MKGIEVKQHNFKDTMPPLKRGVGGIYLWHGLAEQSQKQIPPQSPLVKEGRI